MEKQILIKRSTVSGVIPQLTDLELGELAINTVDGFLYAKLKDGATETISRLGKEIGGVSWNSKAEYSIGDMVTYSDNIYIAIKAGINKPPTANPTYWDALSLLEKGGLEWNSSITYNKGDMVSQEEVMYTAKRTNTNKPPNANGDDWATPTMEEKGGILWNNTKTYSIGDIVSENNILYVSLTSNNGKDPETNPGDWAVGGSGTWLGLSDTPSIFPTGSDLDQFAVRLKADGTGLEFVNDYIMDGGSF